MFQQFKIRSGYSFRKAYGNLKDVKSVLEGRPAITDRASTFAHPKMGEGAILGIELCVVPDLSIKKPPKNYMTFVATESMEPIYWLAERATKQFYYEPKLTYEDIEEVAGSCITFLGRQPEMDKINLKMPDLYLDVGPSTSKGLLKTGLPLVAASDNYMCYAEEREVYEVLCGREATSQTYPMHILSEEEWRNCWPELGDEPLVNGVKLAEKCTAVLKKAELVDPPKPKPLIEMCRDGAKRKGIDLNNEKYAARLKRELDLIAEKKFEDYFYLIADLCQFAKKHMFVGPARGSSCGSLVCYLLDITEVDPLPYDLIFERFIDINRKDLPDIDIDFSDDRRPMVEKYLEEKYGHDRVARLGTVSLYKPKSAIGEAAAGLKVPKWEVEQFKDSIIERSSGDARAMQAVLDTFNDTDVGKELLKKYPEMKICAEMEGHPRHSGQHAAGVVVTASPLIKHAARDARSNSLMLDKGDAEDLNLLKIDCLGLTQLSIFDDCLEMAGKERSWLQNYPMDDKGAFKILNDLKFTSIFQFQGFALQSLVQQVEVSRFDDIVSITALARPGPLHSGGATEWVERRNGKKKVTYDHPLMEGILGDTYGVTIYQEQIMRIAREIGGLSWEDVSTLRKAMSKSKGVEFFNKFKDQFVPGAVSRGMDQGLAEKVWDAMCHYGSWSFNKSHAVAYGLISYWCCVLKSQFPLEFAAAALRREADADKQIKLLRELANEGIKYSPIDPENSTEKWEVANNSLIGPLTGVKGIGPKMALAILEKRKEGKELPKRAQTLLEDPKTPYDTLYPIKLKWPGLYKVPGPYRLQEPLNDIDTITADKGGFFRVVGVIKELNLRDHNETGSVAKRGYEMKGPTKFLNLVIQDDSSSIIAQVDRFKYPVFGKQIVELGEGQVWLFKGQVKKGWRRIRLSGAKHVGKLEA